MKVKVEFTVMVSDDQREAINYYTGDSGRATREEVKKFFMDRGMDGEITISDTMAEMELEKEEAKEE